MSNTVFVRGGDHSASVEQVWGEKTYRQAERDAFFNDGRFVGTDSNSLIQVNTDLSKSKGDMINTPLRARLISDGKVDDAAIEGQESALTYHNMQTQIHKRKEAVRLDGEMTERRTKIKLRTEAKDALALWHADTRDTDILLGLSGLANSVSTITAAAPTSNRYFAGGQKTDGSTGVDTVANISAITNAVNISPVKRTVDDQRFTVNITEAQTGTIFTNYGALEMATYNLPDPASSGLLYTFSLAAAQAVHVDPGTAAIIDECGQTAGKYKYTNDVGASLSVASDDYGNWIVIGKVGIWNEEV